MMTHKRRCLLPALILLITMMFTACGKPTLNQLLEKDPSALDVLYDSQGANDIVIECKDYTVYYEGGTDDSIDAIRYSRGLEETTDRFVEYHYIVEDKNSGWKYIFEDLDDIVIWADRK